MEKKSLTSRVLKTDLVDWKNLRFIQQQNFKDLDDLAKHKLKASLLANSFSQPFYVWEDESGVVFCLDGKHRVLILEELIKEGYEVPYLLPATFIQCDSKKEAAKLVLIYSSIYAKISQQGLFDFIKEYEFQMSEFNGEVDLPEFSMPRFEQKVDLFGTKEDESDDQDEIDETEDRLIIVNQGDVFTLGRHKIFCGSFEDIEAISMLMDGEKARIINTDPPYNLAADYIGNTNGKKLHTDFAMAHGEMTDGEFVEFIKKIMLISRQNSVDGSIHYIFMDFRHAWNMTEASKAIYGSPEPKQVCVWKKDMMALGSFYRSQYELCFIFKSGNEKHLSNLELVNRVRSNIWEYPSAVSRANPDRDQIKNHPTPKPVNMIADCILDTTSENDIVLDWFLGSGTALLACEKTNRICRGVDIEPKYIQQIIKRYVRHCDKSGKPVIFEHLNGNLNLTDFTDIWKKN